MYLARIEMAVNEQVVGVRVPLELWVTPGYAEDLADIFKSYSMSTWNIPDTKNVLREEAAFMFELNSRMNDLRAIVKNKWEEK